jgi:hypothetical protein
MKPPTMSKITRPFKKLSLNTETLRVLDRDALSRVQGGADDGGGELAAAPQSNGCTITCQYDCGIR